MVANLTIPAFAYSDSLIIESMYWSMNCSRIAIVGPSGCGKTTLLNLLASLLPDAPSPIAHSTTISMMFQEPRLMPWLTVKQNLQLVNKQLNEEDVLRLLSEIGLSDSQHDYPKQLSGGMQRRIALARAFCIKPDVLLLDEPFVSLDAPTARECRNLLLKLQHTHNTQTILVTHDLLEAIELADKIIFLSKAPAKDILMFDVLNAKKDTSDPHKISENLLACYPKLLSGELA